MRSIVLAAALSGIICSAAFGQSAHVARAMTFPGEGQGDTPPQTTFAPATPKITLGVQLQNVKAGDKVTADWIAEKTEAAPPNYKIDSFTLTLGPDSIVAFRLSKPDAGWPAGEYRVDLSYNGGSVEHSQRFSVTAGN
jgi:hypothetical protein